MQVKCRLCGKKIDKKDAFQAPTGSGRFYFCNEEEAKTKEEEKLKKAEANHKEKKVDPVYEEVADIFGYRIQNSVLFKEMKLWRGICNDEKILAYLQENKDYLKNTMERLDSSEYARIRYFSAILKNNLGDYKIKTPTVNIVKVETNFELYEPASSVKTKSKRRGLSSIEDEV